MQLRTDDNLKLRRSGVIWNMLGSAMFGASSMLLLMFVNRACDLSTAGVFSISFSTAQVLYMVGIFGANHLQMTDYQERYSFAAYRMLKLISSLLMLFTGVATVWILRFDAARTYMTLLLMLYMMLSSAGELYQSMFFQRDRLDLSGRSVFLRTLMATAAFYVVIVITHDVYWAILALIAAALAGYLLFAVYPARPFLSDVPKRAEKGSVKRLMLECFPLLLSVVLMNLILVCPKYAVDHYLGDETTAEFSMILMPVQIINLFCSFIFRPSLKGIADAIMDGDRTRLARTMRRMTWIVVGVTVLAVVGTYWIGPEALGLFYDAQLTAYRTELAVVIVGSSLFAYSHLLYYVLLLCRKQTTLFINYGITFVIAAASAYLFAGIYGTMGAILAFVATHVVLIAIHAFSLLAALKPVFSKGEEEHAAL